jgi:hypothetical protein
MGSRIYLFQMRDGHGGVESSVAEELLDDSDVSPVFVHVGGATVTQKVATSRLRDACGFDRFGDPVAEVAGAEPIAVSAEEEGLLAHFEEESGHSASDWKVRRKALGVLDELFYGKALSFDFLEWFTKVVRGDFLIMVS